MVVTLSIFAVTPNQSGKKVDPTGRATELANKELKHHKQVAKALGLDKFEGKTTPRTAPNAKKAPAKKAAQPSAAEIKETQPVKPVKKAAPAKEPKKQTSVNKACRLTEEMPIYLL